MRAQWTPFLRPPLAAPVAFSPTAPGLLGAIWLDLKRNKIETVFAVDETIFRASL
jgi:hypothetical protein